MIFVANEWPSRFRLAFHRFPIPTKSVTATSGSLFVSRIQSRGTWCYWRSANKYGIIVRNSVAISRTLLSLSLAGIYRPCDSRSCLANWIRRGAIPYVTSLIYLYHAFMLSDGVHKARFTRHKAKAHVSCPPLSFVNTTENYEMNMNEYELYRSISGVGFF